MRTDIGVDAQGDAGSLSLFCGQRIDDLQFGHALHVEGKDTGIQSEVNLPIALADTGVDNLRGRETGFEGRLYLATAHTVRTQSGFADDAEQARIGIGLHGIVHAEGLAVFGFLPDGLQGLSQQLRVVVVERRAELLELVDGKLSFCHCVVCVVCVIC